MKANNDDHDSEESKLIQQRHSHILGDSETQSIKGRILSIRLSPGYLIFCVINALLTFCLFSYCIYHSITTKSLKPPSDVLFVFVEASLCAFVIIETSLWMFATGKAFWNEWSNIFDFIASVLCSITIIIDATHLFGAIQDTDVYLSVSLLVVRYFSQVIRLMQLAKHSLHINEQQKTTEDVILNPEVIGKLENGNKSVLTAGIASTTHPDDEVTYGAVHTFSDPKFLGDQNSINHALDTEVDEYLISRHHRDSSKDLLL